MKTQLIPNFLVLLLFAFACGKVEKTDSVFLRDSVNVLTTRQHDALAKELKELQDSRGSQIGILIISSLKGEKIEEYSLRVANESGLGRKEFNDGVLIAISIQDRKVRIEVGLGLEKVITNEIAAEIIQKEMAPELKDAKYYEGLSKAIHRIKALLKDNKELIGQAVKSLPDSTTAETLEVNYEDNFKLETYLLNDVLTDTSVIDVSGSIVLLIYPTQEQVDRMIQEQGEDTFYTVADDANFYQGTAIGIIDSLGVKSIATEKKYARYRGEIREWVLEVRKDRMPWNMIFFHPSKKPEIVSSIDVSKEKIREYFELK